MTEFGHQSSLLTVIEGTLPNRDARIHKKIAKRKYIFIQLKKKLTASHFLMMARYCARFQIIWLKATYQIKQHLQADV